MRKLHLIALLSLGFTLSVFAQNSQKKWAIGLGVSSINHSFQGNGIFDEFFQVDNWSYKPPLMNVRVGRYLRKGFVADFSIAAGNVQPRNLDGVEITTGADKMFINTGLGLQIHPNAFFGKEQSKIDPYARVGVTYNYFDFGVIGTSYNTKSTESDWTKNSHGGPNFGAGVNLWLTDKFGLGLESSYNWILSPDFRKDFNDSGDFWQHTASIIFKLGKSDKDGDGILDKDDLCPTVPGIIEFKGCPDTDSDGLQDSEDACPTEAGPMENKGCPWGDKDGDTLKDNVDKCPNEKGELVNDGCPWGDKDNDGVKDNVDKCPNEKGETTNDGCPVRKVDFKEEAAQVTLALQNLEFDVSKAIIRPEGEAKLDAAATIIKSNTGKYLIGGHTDNSGNPITNQKLSEDRAKAVIVALESRGVESGRLVSKGFGSTQPISDNASVEGKQANRRVQVSALSEEEYKNMTTPAPVKKTTTKKVVKKNATTKKDPVKKK